VLCIYSFPVLSSIADITIKVIDVNNHPPKFESANENATVMENTENVTIKTVKAKDQDAGSQLNIRFLPSIVAEKNVTKNVHICSMCIENN
jgi:hypothetical protein